MNNVLEIETKRTFLAVLNKNSAGLILKYYLENKEHLSVWEPERNEDFYTIEKWEDILSESRELFESGKAYQFTILTKDKNEVIGVCNFSNVVHGVFQACHLGYSIARKYEGKGYMFEALKAATGYIFETVGLHRIMANYVPENKRSEAILHKLGFEYEGLAKSYLKINGQWLDHILTSKINPSNNT